MSRLSEFWRAVRRVAAVASAEFRVLMSGGANVHGVSVAQICTSKPLHPLTGSALLFLRAMERFNDEMTPRTLPGGAYSAHLYWKVSIRRIGQTVDGISDKELSTIEGVLNSIAHGAVNDPTE